MRQLSQQPDALDALGPGVSDVVERLNLVALLSRDPIKHRALLFPPIDVQRPILDAYLAKAPARREALLSLMMKIRGLVNAGHNLPFRLGFPTTSISRPVRLCWRHPNQRVNPKQQAGQWINEKEWPILVHTKRNDPTTHELLIHLSQIVGILNFISRLLHSETNEVHDLNNFLKLINGEQP